MKYKILVILFFVFYKSFSCSCSQLSLIDKVKTHDYIAKIKITESKTIENYIDTFNPYFVKIETVKQYFGEKVNEIHLESMNDSSCGMYLPKDSEWIVYGFKNKKDGKIYTSLCSGNFQLNKTIDSLKYKNYFEEYPKQQKRVLNILEELNIKKIKEFNLKSSNKLPKDDGYHKALLSINNLDSKKTFGCYKLIHNEKGEVIDIEVINSLGRKIDQIFIRNLIGSKWSYKKIDDSVEAFEQIILINYNKENTDNTSLKYSLDNN
ncbi:hypothetical protein [Flavobacterium lacisediminis]|uniref:Tissue inhibitor of metalloproteinase n=1 Tax=Flavobacterium lacisediminis TaxID=2989705 RepID=A0ABT3EKM2_9FLAO|nr:hypothetical protein [Flavobacterium lacisediminis]MCW1148679.1 hypothetical protein [Flavobacterium lacisediminis]